MPPTPFKRPRRATIEDVAYAADVSVATVSRALRGLPNVADATRERVRAAAVALNYRPDPAASRLAAGRTKTVTVVVPTLNGWYFSTVVAGAEGVCADAGYEFSVIGLPHDDDRDRLLSAETDLERRTDGLLLVEIPISDAQFESLNQRGIAIATIGNATTSHPTVHIDDEAVGRLAAGHLAALGHRRIGVIGGLHYEPGAFDVTAARRRGFESGLADAGRALDPELVERGDFGIDSGQRAMAALLDRARPPTAVFAMSDEMAFGALMELRVRGLRPAVDVSLVGVDDHEFSRVVELTTIRQRVVDHGAAAAGALISTITGDGEGVEDVHLDAPIELVVRATTGPPAP